MFRCSVLPTVIKTRSVVKVNGFMSSPLKKLSSSTKYTRCFFAKDTRCKWKEGNVLFNDSLNTFTVIWRQTFGEGTLRY